VATEVYEFPTTPTQQALWFIHRMDPASSAYNIPLAFRVRGDLDEVALRAAFEALVARHEILRTLYMEREGLPVQRVHATAELDWRSERIDDADAAAVLERATRHVIAPFDLVRGPLMRVRLDRFADDDALLVLVLHHIVIDHLALGQLATELETMYRDGVTSLPEQNLQFADFAVWTHEQVGSYGSRLEPLRQRLAGCTGVLDLPTDRPRPAVQTSAGAERRFTFGAQTTAAMRQFARTAGASPYVVLLSALKVLLQRYSGQPDIVVGTPFANRGQEELEHVVGCFINTLPIATRFDGIEAFPQLIASVKTAMIEAVEAQDVPFEAIVDAVKPRRDPSFNPLFQVGFVFQEPPVQLRLAGASLEDLQVHSGGAMYDLHFWLWDAGEAVGGLVWYNTDLFDEATVARMIAQYEGVVQQLVERPSASLAEVTLLTGEEKRQLAEWNATAREWPPAASVVDLVQRQARATPERVAVTGSSQRYTYAELDERSDKLAAHLRARGAGPDSLVGIALERDADLLVGLLGILKTGAAYVPLDPDYPRERLKYMMDQAGIRLLVSQESLLGKLPERDLDRVLLDRDSAAIAAAAPGEMPALRPDLRMYVIFTSGSTGLPKGVQIPHRSVMNFLQSMSERPGFTAENRLLAVTTLSFDIAVLELYLPLVRGGTVVIATREQAGDGGQLRALIERESVNVLQATPTTWRLLLAAGWKATPGKTFKALCGGEAMPRDLARELVAAGAELWNMYGPTETTVWSTCFAVRDAEEPIYIGKPIANTACYVLDSFGQPLPIGVPGELHIGGDGVAIGYLGRDDLTAERFIANPFGSGRLYRTGDQVRFKSDGNLEYFSRNDNQVKVRGFRIELGEIEAVLSRHPAVAEVAVVAREFSATDKRLVAYTRFAGGEQLTNTELRSFLRDYLPDYMIPQLLVEVEAMPLTPNGKIDRKALPDPLRGAGGAAEVIPPRTDAEERLAAIWRQVLSVEGVSVDSNFFEIGGHSLLAMQVIFHIEQVFGVRVHPRDLILNTLEQLAAKLPARTPATANDEIAPEPEQRPGVLGKLKQRFRL
jgi:amino acid adenylation domain-containing protein